MSYKSRNNWNINLCLKFDCKVRDKECITCVKFSDYEIYEVLKIQSKCCNANCKTEGIPDFIGSNEVCTFHYVCSKCNKPCDIK